jgi:hypothetical protein
MDKSKKASHRETIIKSNKTNIRISLEYPSEKA